MTTHLLNPGDFAAVIDLETGGFSRVEHALIEVAVLLVDHNWEPVDHYQTYVHPEPGKIVEDSAAGVNGYTPESWGYFGDGTDPSDEQLAAVVSPLVTLAECRQQLSDWVANRGRWHGIAFNKGFDKSWTVEFLPELAAALHLEWRDPKTAYQRWKKEQLGVKKLEKGMTKLAAVCSDLQYEAVTGERWVRHTALDDCYAARFVASHMDVRGFLHNA